ncbi:hypothetical protein WA1_20620 [Scytonema hofmannii PCC 7110]|uniref:Uncharacterized protein n=1 Tax=Scytonema hofmannii PCC 7110 TaxID=128403 RepID=A0A139XCH2_9CYAN|nr:hypothetical protein [Scytonema hofmannii]KYC42375.1 hypothetical protein WA1_20620 [Scytonema hofmannii PCC 7110]
MTKITIFQLHTVDADSIQKLTDAEIDATKGGLVTIDADVRNAFVSAVNSAAFGANLVVNNVLRSIGLGA